MAIGPLATLAKVLEAEEGDERNFFQRLGAWSAGLFESVVAQVPDNARTAMQATAERVQAEFAEPRVFKLIDGAKSAVGSFLRPHADRAVDTWGEIRSKAGSLATDAGGRAAECRERATDTAGELKKVVADRVAERAAMVQGRVAEAKGRAEEAKKVMTEHFMEHAVTVQGKVADAKNRAEEVTRAVTDHVAEHAAVAQEKAGYAAHCASDAARDPRVQVTAGSAAGASIVLGTTGSAGGFVAGGAVGAAAGVVPAVFTFGLSIPVAAAIGSTVGLVSGAVLGGTVGFVGGGAAGYGAYSQKDAIRSGASHAVAKVSRCAELAQEQAQGTADFVRASLSAGGDGSE